MKSQKIKINGLKLNFYFWGNPKKPKLFLFHGWLDTAASFDFLCPFLEKHFYCIAPDMRGYARSEHAKNILGYFFYEYVADLHALFEKFSPKEKVRILGHSLGGAVSSVYAGTYPERVSHLINVEGYAFRDNSPDRGPEKLRNWLDHLHEVDFPSFDNLASFAKRLVLQNPRLSMDRAKFMAKYLTKKAGSKFKMAADPKHKLTEPYLFNRELLYRFWESIQAQCLLVHAEKTQMNQWVKAKEFEEEIRERITHFPKGSPFVTIPDCGHMVHHERPDLLADEVLKFFFN
ncbi:MAG: Hydrolase [uncultured bacterium]|nr:MAG: Hydrolase [uncultured bacterium]